MKVTFEAPDKVNGLMTLVVEEADYKDGVEKKLKDYRKVASLPGFRPGKAPMSMIRREWEARIKIDVINKLVGEQMYKYIGDNNLQVLGEPMASDRQVPVDIEEPAPYTFAFDIAIAPEFSIELTADDKIEYDTIIVDDKAIDAEIDMYTARFGTYEDADVYQTGDSVRGNLNELDDTGSIKEGGISVENALVLPTYVDGDDQKKLFEGVKVGDVITFNPKKAYPDNDAEVAALLHKNKEDVADLTSDFSYQITGISHFAKAAVDQGLFDVVFGTGNVDDEKQFREKIAGQLRAAHDSNSDYKFGVDLRKHCEDKVGPLTFPDELLKRIMRNKNKDKEDDYVDKNYEGAVKELKWHLIREQLAAQFGIKIEDDDLKQTARSMARLEFARYGMNNVPDNYINDYADNMLKNKDTLDNLLERALELKVEQVAKTKVTLVNKQVTFDEFNASLNAKES